MVVFYHCDDDGKCAGYWASKLNQRKTGVRDDAINFIMINYGWSIPWGKIAKDELVYIVDFSIAPTDMDKLLSITPNVVWIDHHISAIDKYANYGKHIDGIRVDGVAGCLLTYFYLKCCVDTSGHEHHAEALHYARLLSPETAQADIVKYLELRDLLPPEFTLLIADYDVWLFEYGDLTKHFHTGFSMIPHKPEDEIWNALQLPGESVFSRCQTIINKGTAAREYRTHWMKNYCDAIGFEATFKEPELKHYSCFAINIAHISNDDFVIDTAPYDVLIGFSFDGDVWTHSLRSVRPSVDVSKIAKIFGGGGHKGAAGFVSDEICIEKVRR